MRLETWLSSSGGRDGRDGRDFLSLFTHSPFFSSKTQNQEGRARTRTYGSTEIMAIMATTASFPANAIERESANGSEARAAKVQNRRTAEQPHSG